MGPLCDPYYDPMIHNDEGVDAMVDHAATARRAVGARIRQARLARRWSQSQLARALTQATGGCVMDAHYVSRWERGERKPGYEWQPVIESVLDLDLDQIALEATPSEPGPLTALMPPPQVIRQPASCLADSQPEDDDMRRRTLLASAGGAMLSGVIDALEPVRRQVDAVLAGPVTEDDAMEWGRAAERHSRLVGRFPIEQVLPGILADLSEISRHVEIAPDSLRPRLQGCSARLTGLSAVSLAGAGYWADAERYWRLAERAARLSGDQLVRSLVASDRAVFSIYIPGSSPAEILRLADDALSWTRGSISKGLAGALAARAQILSLVGDRTGAYSELGELENVFERLDGAWPEARVHHVRSFVYSHVGTVRESLAAQDHALASYPHPSSPGSVQIHMHRARSIIASGDISYGVQHIATMMNQVESSFRHGYVGTSAEFALDALPDKAKLLPEVRDVRALISQGKPS